MITSNYTEGQYSVWTRPNLSVPWYHEWSGKDETLYNEFWNYWQSNEFDGHVALEYPDPENQLTIRITWWHNTYDIEIQELLSNRFQDIVNKIDSYYASVGVQNMSNGVQTFFGAP